MNVFLGTEIKLNIKIDPIENQTMDDFYWEVEAYTSSKKCVKLTSENAEHRIGNGDDVSYIMIVDTSILGVGDILCRITVHLKDSQIGNETRKEVVIINPDITIINGI